jgi:hypothetical protein
MSVRPSLVVRYSPKPYIYVARATIRSPYGSPTLNEQNIDIACWPDTPLLNHFVKRLLRESGVGEESSGGEPHSIWCYRPDSILHTGYRDVEVIRDLLLRGGSKT